MIVTAVAKAYIVLASVTKFTLRVLALNTNIINCYDSGNGLNVAFNRASV
jgi:hypothetical protein